MDKNFFKIFKSAKTLNLQFPLPPVSAFLFEKLLFYNKSKILSLV